LHIEVDRACVSAFDPLRGPDPDLEVAVKAIVSAMDHDWQKRRWSLDLVQCPQQQNESDCGVFVILYVIYLVVGMPLASVATFDGGLWRMLFVLLVRKSPLTSTELASVLAVGGAASPVASESSSKQLIQQYEQASLEVERLQAKLASLDHAKSLLTRFQGLCRSLITPETAPTSHLARNQEFLDNVLARGCSDDKIMIEAIEESNKRIQVKLDNSRLHSAKMSDLNILLDQLGALTAECTRICSEIANKAADLMSSIQLEQATLSAWLKKIGETNAL
jgi:hypothetical protein